MDYLAHWVIGILAAIVWAFGKNWGLEASFVSFAAWTLPIVVGHALSVSQRTQINVQNTLPDVPSPEPVHQPVQEAQP